MCIWNKVLVGLISVASLVFFYLAARTLQTQKYWAELAKAYESKIARVERENAELLDGLAGNASKPGLRQVRLDLYRQLIDRRRMWERCEPRTKLGDDSTEVAITFPNPPSGIVPKTILYAFEEADAQQKGRYMGEYVVTAADKQKATLVPTSKPTPRELEKLKTAKRPWVLYEVMPRDGHDAFASLTSEQKKAMLPADYLAECLKDGKPAAKNDPSDRVVDGRYVRMLRDYSVLLGDERAKLILLNDSIEAAQRDKQLAIESLALAKKAEKAGKQDVAAAVEERAKMTRQRDIVAKHQKRLQEKLDGVLTEITQLLKKNKVMADQIAKFQLEAARRIDRRARDMAKTGTERF